MKIAVLSGKGGAGKTFAAVNLAVAAGKSTYIDCDVEEPNGRLFLKGEVSGRERVYTPVPSFDPDICSGCRKCVDFCGGVRSTGAGSGNFFVAYSGTTGGSDCKIFTGDRKRAFQ